MDWLFNLNSILTGYERMLEPAFDKDNECYKKVAGCRDFYEIRTLLAGEIRKYKAGATTAASAPKRIDEIIRHFGRYKEHKALSDKSYTQESRKVVFAYYTAILYYATSLFYETAENELCAAKSLLRMFGPDDLRHAAEAMDFPSFDETRERLCADCEEQECNARVRECENKGESAASPGTNEQRKNEFLQKYPGAQEYFDRLVSRGWLNDDYSRTYKTTTSLAAIIAKQIGIECHIEHHFKTIGALWAIPNGKLITALKDAKKNTDGWKNGIAHDLLKDFYPEGKKYGDSYAENPRVKSALHHLFTELD